MASIAVISIWTSLETQFVEEIVAGSTDCAVVGVVTRLTLLRTDVAVLVVGQVV